jgi:diguanylate cyclase (GGDEF)-like protein
LLTFISMAVTDMSWFLPRLNQSLPYYWSMQTTALKSVPSAMLIPWPHNSMAHILLNGSIYPVFQPIVALADATVYAHEALIRGPQGSPLHTPEAMLREAERESLIKEFETACVTTSMQYWSQLHAPGRLFLNLSANVLTHAYSKNGKNALLDWIAKLQLKTRMIVLELTEHERVDSLDQLLEVAMQLRSVGVSLALDDFGDGRSSLRLWSELKPEFVKIDKYFIKDVSKNGNKLKTIQALQQLADLFGSALVAEGIEGTDDLRVLRDLGITYGQGYLLGHPSRQPLEHVAENVRRIVFERQVAVFPEIGRASQGGQLRSLSLINAPTVTQETPNNELACMFLEDASLHAVAVLQGDKPVGIINRAQFMNEYSRLYYREVWGRKPCVGHVNFEPRLVERNFSVDELVGILTSQDQRYLSDGFIATHNGSYIGIGTGDQLVRSVTEMRIEAARHANPLTFLPGNIPISMHMERLMKKKVSFVACYADLNNFKPFNDHYGYWRGDEMIRLLARISMEQCDSQRDFLGHVGGDDFIYLFQSTDWRERCQRIVQEFSERAFAMFDEEAQQKGGIEAEDRHGVIRFFPCTTVSIGAVAIDSGKYSRAEEVANLAAMAKHQAKMCGGLSEFTQPDPAALNA